ncbi:MAG: hypothetical protein IKZ82_14260 [Clostridia bacterium]|nr:hypothetical protein [Clostridia bacterium]
MGIALRSRYASAFLAAILLLSAIFSLYGCESAPKELQFKNELKTTVNIYFSNALDDDWSDKPTRTGIRGGAQVGLNFSDFDGASGKKTDIGAIDENSVNYDIYDVVLIRGDLIVLTGDENGARFVITHSDGTSSIFSAIIKPSDG